MLKMVVARLSNTKLILIVSLKAYIQGPIKAPFKVNSVILFQPYPTSLARQALPDKPANKAEARQKASTGANLSGSCVLVGLEAFPTEIPTTNTLYD
ncbi:hypothetical protein ACFX1Q_019807 [Malus domestica]